MDSNSISQFLYEWLDLIIDIGLICALFFLWLGWYRNGQRQLKLEQMLAATASQLEEASRHLSLATDAIEHLQKQEQEQEQSSAKIKPAKQPSTKQLSEATSRLPSQNSTQATMILRMQREGESSQTIAERLDMPLAQVKLLLKLHAASSSVGC